MKNRHKIIIAITAFLVGAFVLYIGLTRGIKTVEILGIEARIAVVRNPVAQAQGLSGQSLEEFSAKADGMLFVFPNEKERVFWMRNMQFNIDIVWLRDGKVVKIERNVPAPQNGEEPARMYSAPFAVDGVLELPAGKAAEYGLTQGLVLPSLDL